jgi:Flp pilus assembly protein TadD
MIGELRAALKDLDRALELNPRFADAYNNCGSVRHINGDLKGAASDYSSAVRQARRRPLE